MKEMVNKYLLAVAKFMLKMYLRQPRFTYSVCGSFTIYKERRKNLKKREIQVVLIKKN